MAIELLLAHQDDHRPVLDRGLPAETAASAPRAVARPRTESLSYQSGDPGSLPEQRWGIVAPEGPAGDRLLSLVDRLRGKRQEDQGGAAVRVYRVPQAMDGETSAAWMRKVYCDPGTPEPDRPRYLVLLGDLDVVSLDLQQVLASAAFVGRLAFRGDDGYLAYVDKILAAERAAAAQSTALFFAARDGTEATALGYGELLAPSVRESRVRRASGVLAVRDVVEIAYHGGAAAQALLDAAKAPAPSILLTVSHGAGPPRGGWTTDQQRALQGSMILGASEQLTAADLAGKPFLPGGVWFFLACFGGGVPATSAYRPWLLRLQGAGAYDGGLEPVLAGLPKPGDRPFVAALPQAVLASPNGPLAVMAHVDLAWTYSFEDVDPDQHGRASRYQGIFRALADGKRVGEAHGELMSAFDSAVLELETMGQADEEHAAAGPAAATRAADGGASDTARDVRRASLWMQARDVAGYVLLGDPAARLRVPGSAPAAATTAGQPPDVASQGAPGGLSSLVGFAPQAAAGGPGVADKEKAVLAMLRGDETPRAIAARSGVSQDDLEQWVEIYKDGGRRALGGQR